MPNYTNLAFTDMVDKTSDSAKNCSLCSAAGVVNLYHGTIKCSSLEVAKSFNSTDDQMGLGDHFRKQAAHIQGFVRKKVKVTDQHWRAKDVYNGWSLEKGNKSMLKNFPDKTIFAVCVKGCTQTGGEIIHWLNAVRVGKGIRYFDYQVCRDVSVFEGTSTVNPASCLKPFVGIAQQAVSYTVGGGGVKINKSSHIAFHGPNQKGVFKDNAKFLAILGFTK